MFVSEQYTKSFYCLTDCDITIENDTSVSRRHAILHVNGATEVGNTWSMSVRTVLHTFSNQLGYC